MTRIKLDAPLRHRSRLRRLARRGYWLDSREAGAELGVTPRRVRQLAEELRMRTREADSAGGKVRLLRGCCVEAAKDRERCDVAHEEDHVDGSDEDRRAGVGRARGTERPSFLKTCQAESTAPAVVAA